jgi:hypothetical protein
MAKHAAESGVLYDWGTNGRISDWHLEGRGELLLREGGALCIRTYHCGPGRRATSVWLRDLELPASFEVDWAFRSDAVDPNNMILFHAQAVLLAHFFEDPRPDARYCDLASYRKIVSHTIGFNRGTYGRPSILRKIGGNVPLEWADIVWGGPYQQAVQEATALHSVTEPLTPADKGKIQRFRVQRKAPGIRFWVNDILVHDWRDDGRYPYWPQPLSGGRLGFRNFGGFADDLYERITIRAMQ